MSPNPENVAKISEPITVEQESLTAEPERYTFHVEGRLYLPVESRLPTDQCIRCEQAPVETVQKAIRSGRSFRSWYGRRPTTEIALCKKHLDDRRVALALTWSLMGVGLLLAVVGAITMNATTAGVGAVVASLSGIFGAREPIQGQGVGDETFDIIGVCDAFVRRLPEHELIGS